MANSSGGKKIKIKSHIEYLQGEHESKWNETKPIKIHQNTC
jgi:hypothetical protein